MLSLRRAFPATSLTHPSCTEAAQADPLRVERVTASHVWLSRSESKAWVFSGKCGVSGWRVDTCDVQEGQQQGCLTFGEAVT